MDVADDRHPAQGQIADNVENFVPDEFVGEPEWFRVEDPLFRQGNGIIERPAARQTAPAQGFEFFDEAESPRWRNGINVSLRAIAIVEFHFKLLMPDQRVRKVNLAGDPQLFGRLNKHETIVIADFESLEDSQVSSW